MHTKHRMTFFHMETTLAVLGDRRRYLREAFDPLPTMFGTG